MANAMRTSADVLETRVANVAAGSAANSTISYYIPVGHYRKMGLQFEWTPGGAGGTVTVLISGTIVPPKYGATSTDPSTLTYQDITSSVFGVAYFSDDFLIYDHLEKMACFSYIKVSIQVANKDANTAYVLYARQVA